MLNGPKKWNLPSTITPREGESVSRSVMPPQTVDCQAPLSMGFSRQEYWRIFFSRGSSWSRAQIHIFYVSCIGRQVLNHWHRLGGLQSMGSQKSRTLLKQLSIHPDCSPLGSFVGFPRQGYWSGLPFPSPWDLPDPGTESMSLSLQANSLLLSHQGSLYVWYEWLTVLFNYWRRQNELDTQKGFKI